MEESQVWRSPSHEYGQMGNFKVYTTFDKSLGQTAPFAWKCLKTQFWGPLTNWKFEPFPKAHAHSDCIINKHRTGQKTRYGFIMACIELYAAGKNSLLHWKARICYLWLSKKDTPTKTRWSQTQFQKGQPTPFKTTYAFPHSPLVREFWPQIYSLWKALDWGLLSKTLASTKMGRA